MFSFIRASLKPLFVPMFWRAPRKADVLVFDPENAEFLFRYLDQAQTQPLCIRGESINLFVLVKCILKMRISKFYYLCEYIGCVSPSVIITLTDNNRHFYRIKNVFPQIITIFVQNGWRSRIGDIFSHFESLAVADTYRVDYMLTFGSAVGREYSKYVKGAFIPIGSIKNNAAPRQHISTKGVICLISNYSYLAEVSLNEQELGYHGLLGRFTEKIAKAVCSYCEQNGLDFWIAGRTNDDREISYLSELIGSDRFQFRPRHDPLDSYNTIDQAEVVVALDSSMGYESLARGNKTAIFSIRSAISSCLKFGWPATFPDVGPFWSNIEDESIFVSILDYLRSVSDDEWLTVKRQYAGDLIEYDPGNIKLVTLLKDVGVRLRPEAFGEAASISG